MEFGYKVYGSFDLFGLQFKITETHVNTWILGGILLIFAIIVRIAVRNFKDVPTSKFQNLIEVIVDAMDGFVRTTMGDKFAYFGNWFFGVFASILVFNISGLFGFRPPTADLATTAAFGLTTFFIMHGFGIAMKKGKYFKAYFEPSPLLLPINLIGEIATPVSLSFRLFGNILGGYIIMSLLYGLFPIWLKIGIPAPLHGYFDVFAGSLQAFIFSILSMTFITNMISEGEEA